MITFRDLIGHMNAIKAFRRRHGLSQLALAEALGFSAQATISQYERGIRVPDVDTARRFIAVAATYGDTITLDDLYPQESAA